MIAIPWFSPAYKAGGPIQSVMNLVKSYTHPQYFIITGTKDADGALLEKCGFDSWANFNDHTQVNYTATPGSTLAEAIKKFDPKLLFIIGLFDWNFNIKPLFFAKVPVKILSVRGMLHPGALTQKPFKKRLFLFLMKMSGIHKRIFFHATDEAEKKYILEVFGSRSKVIAGPEFPKPAFPKKGF